ncbi:MAG: phosphoglycerate dehydrogenase [Acidobacteriota bacterium]
MYRILISDPLNPIGIAILRDSGAEVRLLEADERDKLPELLPDFDALVVRSGTTVTAELLDVGKRLKVVGRAGIGVDNVDVKAATERGILVVNAPTANVLSATEHTLALLLSLARKVPSACASLRTGAWERKKFVGMELHGKTLGVIGFGRIGQQVAARARAFEMEVVAYDPFLGEEAAKRLGVDLLPLEELLAAADVITLHTPLTDDTKNLLNAERIAQMKAGALLINCGRGGTVDEKALLAALDDGRLAGAALDVFSQEPIDYPELVKHPKVVVTPHIGAQTREAQERISTQTAHMVLESLGGSLAVSAVNLPFASTGTRGEPYLALGEKLGRLVGSLVHKGLERLEVRYWGLDNNLRTPVAVAVLKGALTPLLGTAVNYVNAERIAASRGIELVQSVHTGAMGYPLLVEVEATGADGAHRVAGTLFGDGGSRVVLFDGHRLEFQPSRRLLVVRNDDVPGVVGRLGTLLGEGGINIADIHLARDRERGEALAVLRVDADVPDSLVERISAEPQVQNVQRIDLDS